MHDDQWLLIIPLGFVLRLINQYGNFFLYLLIIPKIRDELRIMFCCKVQTAAAAQTTMKPSSKSAEGEVKA